MNALKLKHFVCFLSVCFITACAPPKLTPDFSANKQEPVAGAQTKTQASSISVWDISGAIAARNDKKGWTASLNWVQQGANQYQIHLFGPLGGGAVLIEKNGAVVTYKDGPNVITSHNADELLQKQTGIRLPVHDLYYWVRGLSAPGAVQSSQSDPAGHLVGLSQSGYKISYADYITVDNVDLPRKMQLQGNGVRIKLVIKRWRI